MRALGIRMITLLVGVEAVAPHVEATQVAAHREVGALLEEVNVGQSEPRCQVGAAGDDGTTRQIRVATRALARATGAAGILRRVLPLRRIAEKDVAPNVWAHLREGEKCGTDEARMGWHALAKSHVLL